MIRWLLIFLVCPLCSIAQGEGNIWVNTPHSTDSFCFIDFNSGLELIPMEFSETSEIFGWGNSGGASICDKEGNLLFYVGNNNSIYTRQHRLMPRNFAPVEGVSHNYHIIVKRPGSESQYYVIQYLYFGDSQGSTRISYCIVDMDLNGGMGDVMPGYLDIVVDNSKSAYGAGPPITVVKGNCDEFWLVGHFRRYNDTLRGEETLITSYHITEAGISTEPAITRLLISKGLSLAINSKLGLAIIHSADLYIYNFDKSTGYLSGGRLLMDGGVHYRNNEILQPKFDLTEDNLMIPIPRGASGTWKPGFYLYNLNFSDTNINSIRSSLKQLFFLENAYVYSQKVGPDNSYYFLYFVDSSYMSHYSRLVRASSEVVSADLDLPNSGLNLIGYFPSDNAVWPKGDIFNPSQIVRICHPGDKARLTGYFGASRYRWSTGETTASIAGTLGNTYWVRSEVCDAVYYDTFVVALTTDSSQGIENMVTEICSGAQVSLSADGDSSSSFLWRNERGQILGQDHTIRTQVYYPGKIYLDETTLSGCIFTDSVTFTTEPCCDLLIPNSFSPNGDGLNDVFSVVAEADKQIEVFHIYNRYGQLLYKSTHMYDSWDGTYLGEPQPVGVYYYVLQYRCYGADGELHSKKGDITLLR